MKKSDLNILLMIVVAIFIGGYLAVAVHIKRKIKEPCKSVGYTVINADSIVTSCGDTLSYNWNQTHRK